MIDAEFVTAIRDLTHQGETQPLTEQIALNGKTYLYRNNPTEYGRTLGDIIGPPKTQALPVTTLTGFVDAIKAEGFAPEAFIVHVEDFLTVALKMRSADQYGFRTTYVKATHTPTGVFKFDDYYSDIPKFLIHLQSTFLTTDALLYVIKLASNLKAANSVQTQDDGFSQSIVVKTGEVSTAEVKVQPRVKLIPMRTFPEAAAVESEFLIRFTQTPGQAPAVGLFDVSGKVWQGQSMIAIKTWLAGEIDAKFPIIA
jgi:hypothetical protein